ncbi:MAG TPA: hypothetical protein V6D28_08695 [Leptolyngbyaceae cyanobacterium]
MKEIQLEIETIRTHIKNLQKERASLTVKIQEVVSDSPEAIAQAYRRQAKEDPELFAEIKGIDDAIAALEAKLHQKETQLQKLQITAAQQTPLQQLEEASEQARIHTERINQMAEELVKEVQALKAIANEISPLYWQVHYKPFITGFKSITVPLVRLKGDVWSIVNRQV